MGLNSPDFYRWHYIPSDHVTKKYLWRNSNHNSRFIF